MYHLTEMASTLTPTSWFYSLYCQTLFTKNQRDFRSRLEFSLLLDSGASISVLNFQLISLLQNASKFHKMTHLIGQTL